VLDGKATWSVDVVKWCEKWQRGEMGVLMGAFYRVTVASRCGGAGRLSIPFVLKPKRRGRGDA
jgi:hypothetical protein